METKELVRKSIEGFSERIGACALLWHAESIEHAIKAVSIAEARNVSIEDAARIYITGALKCSVRRGSAKSIESALEQLEYEQVTDRGLSVKGFTNSVARDVKRLEKMTGTDYTRIVNGERTIVEDISKKEDRKPHTKNMGKVLGTLYVEYDAIAASTEPAYMLEYADMEAAAIDIDSAIGTYIADYVSRLSHTARRAIAELVASKLDSKTIISGKDAEAIRLRNKAQYLYSNFPKADAITTRDYITLLRQYAA